MAFQTMLQHVYFNPLICVPKSNRTSHLIKTGSTKQILLAFCKHNHCSLSIARTSCLACFTWIAQLQCPREAGNLCSYQFFTLAVTSSHSIYLWCELPRLWHAACKLIHYFNTRRQQYSHSLILFALVVEHKAVQQPLSSFTVFCSLFHLIPASPTQVFTLSIDSSPRSTVSLPKCWYSITDLFSWLNTSRLIFVPITAG